MKTFDVAIIGAGTAGLTARREVAKKTDNYVVIDDGPLGTTCARVGCMPSKVLIQVANDFDRRQKFAQMGIEGGEHLSVNPEKVMTHVRALRDRFVRGVMGSMAEWENHLLSGRAVFIDPHTLEVNGEQISAEKIIIATGSSAVIPPAWLKYREHLVTTDDFFEMSSLPQTMAVIGFGVIGTELGLALHRLGADVVGFTSGRSMGGLTDPALQDYVIDKVSREMKLHFNGADILGESKTGRLLIQADDQTYEVEKALVAIGRTANVSKLGLDRLGLKLSKFGVPEVEPSTMKLKELPHIFLPGDVNAARPLLHEAADEGIIAGHNAVFPEECFKRRIPLGITFSEPNIATVGLRYQQLVDEGVNFVVGKVSFEGQGRSIVKLKEEGLLHVYADKRDGKLLGAELYGPDGEHLAHLLAWAMSVGLTAREALTMPFYHPTVEEGLRTALRHCANQLDGDNRNELFRCADPPIR